MLRTFLLLVALSAVVPFDVGQTVTGDQKQVHPHSYRPGDHIEFTVHLDGDDAKSFKFSSASLFLNGAVPFGELASSSIVKPTVSTPSLGVYVLRFDVGEYVYPGDYGLTVTFQTSDGTLVFPWDSQSMGIAPPVHIVNPRHLHKPTVLVDGLRPERAAQLPPVATTGAASKITAADIGYMQGMVMHHGQAVDMCDLVRTHTDDPRIWQLGRRVGVPQAREIGFMRNWLRSRGQSVEMEMPKAMPGMPDMDMNGDPMPAMPGMLTPAQMTALGNAHGQEFNKLFLSGMIQHHSGALVMTDELFASPNGGQEPELYIFAKQIILVQQAEIGLMQSMQRDVGSPVTSGLPRHISPGMTR